MKRSLKGNQLGHVMVTSGKQFAIYDHVILGGAFVGLVHEIGVIYFRCCVGFTLI